MGPGVGPAATPGVGPAATPGAGDAGRQRTARLMETQALWCAELGSPLYAGLMRHAAEDVRGGGVLADVLAGHAGDPEDSALALRLFGAVHQLVLEGSAPQLNPHYPSVGGADPDPDRAWPAFRSAAAEHRDAVRALLSHPPQTNDVGRSAALLGGLLHIAARTGLAVRLYEIGASAGLNLRADHFRYGSRYGAGNGAAWGPEDSPVVLGDAWSGDPPPVDAPLEVAERRGCDPRPADPGTAAGRARLTAHVWPDQAERLARLQGAFEVARRVHATVVRASAAELVSAMSTSTGVVTVLWHSVTWQYLDEVEQGEVRASIERLGASASDGAPFAHLWLEPGETGCEVGLRLWPGGAELLLGRAHPHGVPVTWSL
ncbi:MAG: DUF2332 domain-containing protein [Carbonactinosporaceae bacterium]